jgi:hypothetical protein
MTTKQVNRTRKTITNSLRPDLDSWLRGYSAASDIPISKLLDRAIELLQKESK